VGVGYTQAIQSHKAGTLNKHGNIKRYRLMTRIDKL
jgi:hypothetical protein